jgi:hypothetical protein
MVQVPDEVATDRTTQLEGVPGPELAGQVRRDLTVIDPLDRQLERGVLGRRRDRVRTLCLIAVLCCQAHIDVLTRQVTWPARHIENERLRLRGLGPNLRNGRQAPGQSPV